MDLKALLADNAKLPNDREIELGEGIKIRVGDLRDAQKAAEAAEQAARAREAAAAKQLEEAGSFYAKVQSYEEELKKAAPAAKPNAYDFTTDPVLKPFDERVKAIEDKLQKEYEGKFKTLEQNLQAASAWALRRQWQQDFDGIKDRPENLKLDEALQFAQRNRIVDEMGVPNVREAVARMTEPQRLEAIKKQAFEDGRKKAMEEAALAAMPKPNSNIAEPVKSGLAKSLDEAFAAAATDSELNKQWNSLDWSTVTSSNQGA